MTALQEMALWQDLVTAGRTSRRMAWGWHGAEHMQATAEAAEFATGKKLPNPASAYYTNAFLA